MQHDKAKVGNFLTLAINHTSVIAFFLFTDKRTKFLILISFHSTNAQYRNLLPTVVQIAYTFAVILCKEWNKAITRKYQSVLR